MNEPAKQGVNIGSGDKGVDRSQTTVDNSSRVSKTVDDHSVRTTTVHHHSPSRRSFLEQLYWVVGIVGIVVGIAVGIVALLDAGYFRSNTSSMPTTGPIEQRPSGSAAAPETSRSRAKEVPNLKGGEAREPEAVPRPVDSPSPVSEPRSAPATAPGRRFIRGAEEPAPAGVQPIAPPIRSAEPPRLDPANFLNRGMLRPGLTAVLMVDDRRGPDAILTQQVAALVGGVDGLFKPPFVGDGLFSRAHNGDAEVLQDIGVTADVARVLLGTRSVSFSPTEVAGQALVRATVSLSVRVIRPADRFASSMAAARDIGAGFDEDSATTVAMENVLKKLLPQLR